MLSTTQNIFRAISVIGSTASCPSRGRYPPDSRWVPIKTSVLHGPNTGLPTSTIFVAPGASAAIAISRESDSESRTVLTSPYELSPSSSQSRNSTVPARLQALVKPVENDCTSNTAEEHSAYARVVLCNSLCLMYIRTFLTFTNSSAESQAAMCHVGRGKRICTFLR